MAREIKYFNGSTTGTIYTVPAGRTAKIIVNYVDTVTNATNLFIGGRTAFTSSIVFGSPINATSSSSSLIFPGTNQAIGSMSGTPYVVNNIWYIGAGATVSSSGGSTGYSFLVIEEY